MGASMVRKGKTKGRVFPNDGDILNEDLPDGRMNVSQYLAKFSNDENFVPVVNDEFVFTDAAPGTFEKVCVLAYRVRRGLPLFHPQDAQKKL